MELDKAIKSRRSIRRYSAQKPDWRDIIECIDSMRYAPKAGNISTLKVILVSDKEKIQKISEASQQEFVAQANYIIVVCSNPSMLKNEYGAEGEIFNRQQNGAAIQNFLLKVQEKGLSTCWIGYFIEKKIKEVLEIPDKMKIEAFFPIGYESKAKGHKSKMRQRIELDSILFFEKYGNKKMRRIRKIEA